MNLDESRSQTPLRQLLYVEWILLGIAVFVTLPFATIEPNSDIDWSKLSIILLFGLMGLRLPRQYWHKLVYTAAELGLIVLLISIGGETPIMVRLLPQLSLIIVIRSCQLFRTWGLVAVFGMHGLTALYTLSVFENQGLLERLSSPPTPWQINVLKTNALVFFTMTMVFVSLLVNALLAVYRNQQELIVAHQQLRRYAAKVEDQATLYERNRIAREIHDSLGHSLTAQTILLENALLFLSQDINRARSYLLDAKNTAYQSLKDVSGSVRALRTSPLQQKTLPVELPALVSDICQPAHIDFECTIDLVDPLADDVSLALFRIVQEALTNAVKHSQATFVQVKLVTKCDRLHLQVLDNGKGFDPSKNTTGFGLRGIRERAINLGGYCQFWSAPGAGCRVSVILPLPAASQSPA
ncbi:MAG: sensor histidine kinase [Cyanobacteria bacterium J06639_14]